MQAEKHAIEDAAAGGLIPLPSIEKQVGSAHPEPRGRTVQAHDLFRNVKLFQVFHNFHFLKHLECHVWGADYPLIRQMCMHTQ